MKDETFLANTSIIVQLKNTNFVWMGTPDLREEQVKKGPKLEKVSFSNENQRQLSEFCSGRIEAIFLHILIQNDLFIYL